jgi:hypothetical protein
VLVDRLAKLEERLQAAAGQAGEQPVDQHLDVLEGETTPQPGRNGGRAPRRPTKNDHPGTTGATGAATPHRSASASVFIRRK